MLIDEEQHQLSAARRWSDRPDVRSSGILSKLDANEIKRQEVGASLDPGPAERSRNGTASHIPAHILHHAHQAIAEVMHTEEAYAIDLSALNELLLQPMHVRIARSPSMRCPPWSARVCGWRSAVFPCCLPQEAYSKPLAKPKKEGSFKRAPAPVAKPAFELHTVENMMKTVEKLRSISRNFLNVGREGWGG